MAAGQLRLPLAPGNGHDDGVAPDPVFVVAPKPSAEPGIVVVRRRGTRRYVLRVLDDGTIRVTLPWWGSRKGALAFADSQREWIERERARQPRDTPASWRPGSLVLVDGVPHPIGVGADGSATLAGAIVSVRTDDAERLRRDVLGWLRARARQELPPALLALAERHELAVTRITIRNQSSLWGSCSPRGVISLNWRLVQMPPWVREYVLIHELMHRRELNHSARFWRLVASACPRYLEARQWLRREGHTLG